MKHGLRPTRRQKIRIRKAGLRTENWLVIREHPDGRLTLQHKQSGTVRTLPVWDE